MRFRQITGGTDNKSKAIHLTKMLLFFAKQNGIAAQATGT